MSISTPGGIVIPDHNIEIPASMVSVVEDQSELTRDEIAEHLPVNLGRGVPPFTNKQLINAVDVFFLDEQERGDAGHHTYTGEKHPDLDDANAFRGDREYISLAVDIMRDEFGVDIKPSQLLTGTNGGQDLVTEVLDHQILDENRRPATSQRTFDRTKRHFMRRMGKGGPAIIRDDESGQLDLNDIEKHFAIESKGSLFLVTPGSNPDGKSMKRERLKEICEIAQEKGGTVQLDGAYARLHHNEEDQMDLSDLQEFFDDGTLTMVFTGTKEGGRRGPAFAVGSEEYMTKLLALRSDRLLSPQYDLQRKHARMETMTTEDLQELWVEGVFTFQDFLDLKIRPHLAENFAILKSILGSAEIRMSNMDVKHGYNVSVLLPDDGGSERKAQFFAKLRSLGVNSPDLSGFSNGGNENGFRIPFGGFSPDECRIFCTLIAQAYFGVYG